MEKTLASQVIATIRAAEKNLGALNDLSEKIIDDQEKRTFRRCLADIMVLYIDLTMSIVRQYPDLDPDKRNSAKE